LVPVATGNQRPIRRRRGVRVRVGDVVDAVHREGDERATAGATVGETPRRTVAMSVSTAATSAVNGDPTRRR